MNRGISTKALSERFILKVAATLFCVVVADFLMFDEHIGWTLGLFGATVLACVLLFNPKLFSLQQANLLSALIFGQCLLMLERTSFLSFLLVFIGLIYLSISNWRDIGNAKLSFFTYFANIFLTPFLLISAKRAAARKAPKTKTGNLIRGWALPVGLSILFLIFFSNANPILANLFSKIDLSIILDFMKPGRWFVWLLVGLCTFHLIRLRLVNKRRCKKLRKLPRAILFYTKNAVIRSLVSFNIIFLFQSITDIMYLWGGWSLPDGITYAEYAHKGAYPLIITALLAGLFVILTTRAGKEVSNNKWVRRMIYFWLSQNIFLVFSSIFRTLLYVEYYSLTYLRIAALIWMVLVAGGLLILILRIAYEKHDNWMLNRLFILLFSVLYLASLPNYAAFIANYNYMHSKQVSGKGTPLDLYYLSTLSYDGEAIPILFQAATNKSFSLEDRQFAKSAINAQFRTWEKPDTNWRAWTYRNQRTFDYVKRTNIKKELNKIDDNSNWHYDY